MRRLLAIICTLSYALLLGIALPATARPQATDAPPQNGVIIHNPEQMNRHLEMLASSLRNKTICIFRNNSLISAQTLAERSIWYDYGNAFRATVYPQGMAEFEFTLKDNARLWAVHQNPQLLPKLTTREKAALQEAQNRIRTLISADMEDEQKFRILHDDLIRRANYTRQEKSNAADLLLDGTGTCEAYSRALWLLCRMAGLPCHIVYGNATEPHAWNLVCLEGRWYHSDATWNDPIIPGHPERHTLSHRYYLLSDAQIAKDHSWTRQQLPAATSRDRNFFRTRKLYFESDTPLWLTLCRAIERGEAGAEVYLTHYRSASDFRQRLQQAAIQYPILTDIVAWHGPESAPAGVVHFTFRNAQDPQPATMSNLNLCGGVLLETKRLLNNIDTKQIEQQIQSISAHAESWWQYVINFFCSLWHALTSWF